MKLGFKKHEKNQAIKRKRQLREKLFLIFFASLLCCTSQEDGAIKKIIFDTDIGGDIDDLGALYALHVYADQGLCEIVGIMSSWSMAYHVNGIDAVNTYFGRPDIPIGAYEDEFFEKEEYTWYLGENFPRDEAGISAPKATLLYRKLLTHSADTSLTLVVTGRLNNIYKLLKSEPDSISDLDGTELIAKKVRKMFVMGGHYPKQAKKEANFRNAGSGVAKYVIDNFPKPIVFNGGEIGHTSAGYGTGTRINELPEGHILKEGYRYFFKNPPDWTTLKPSDTIPEWSIWDVITVQVAVTGTKDYFDLIENGYNQLDVSGTNTWQDTPNKNHSYLIKRMAPKIYADSVIEPLFLTPPKARK